MEKEINTIQKSNDNHVPVGALPPRNGGTYHSRKTSLDDDNEIVQGPDNVGKSKNNADAETNDRRKNMVKR